MRAAHLDGVDVGGVVIAISVAGNHSGANLDDSSLPRGPIRRARLLGLEALRLRWRLRVVLIIHHDCVRLEHLELVLVIGRDLLALLWRHGGFWLRFEFWQRRRRRDRPLVKALAHHERCISRLQDEARARTACVTSDGEFTAHPGNGHGHLVGDAASGAEDEAVRRLGLVRRGHAIVYPAESCDGSGPTDPAAKHCLCCEVTQR